MSRFLDGDRMKIICQNWNEMPQDKMMLFFTDLEELMHKYHLYGGVQLE